MDRGIWHNSPCTQVLDDGLSIQTLRKAVRDTDTRRRIVVFAVAERLRDEFLIIETPARDQCGLSPRCANSELDGTSQSSRVHGGFGKWTDFGNEKPVGRDR